MTDQQATMPTVTGKYHPAALLLPEMSEQEYRELVEDIREHGQREPISKDRDGLILDGRHRWRACQELGIEPRIIRHAPPLDGHELEAWKVAFVISRNVHRRHLTTQQRAAIAAELATMKRGTRTDLPSNDGKSVGLSNKQAAQMMKVSEPTVERAKARLRADPEAHEKAKAGTLGKARPKPVELVPLVEGVDYEVTTDQWGFKHRRYKGRQPLSYIIGEAMDILADMRAVANAAENSDQAALKQIIWGANLITDLGIRMTKWCEQRLEPEDASHLRRVEPEPVEELSAGGVIIRGVAPDDQWTIRGARIREARKAKGMTGKELSMMAHVAPNIVSMCERTVRTKSGGPAAGRPAYAKLEAALGIAMT